MFPYSFILLKPDAVKRELTEQVMEYFFQKGIQIVRMNVKKATEELMAAHYEEVFSRFDETFRERMYEYFVGNTVVPMVLWKEGTELVPYVREIVGATEPVSAKKGTIRGELGTDSYAAADREGRTCYNLIHASDSKEAVSREIGIWFGQEAANRYQ